MDGSGCGNGNGGSGSGNGSNDADRMFECAWRARFPALRRRARYLASGRPDQADELLAETALKSLCFMRRAPHKLTDPEEFLFVVLRHVFLDAVRRGKREAQVFDASAVLDEQLAGEGGDPVDEWMQRGDRMERLLATVEAMPREQKRLFVWRFVEDRSYPELAELLGVNQPLVRKRVQLLRARLRAGIGVRDSQAHGGDVRNRSDRTYDGAA